MASINLGEVADIITGPFGSMLHKSDYRETGTPVIMPQDIGDRTLSLESIARIGQRDAERLTRYVTVENDIVYARRGDVEKHAFITKDEAGALCGTGCLRVRVDECKADPLFVSFYLNRPESRMWIRLHAVGSNMPNINTDILSELPMELPDLEVQRKVGNLLRHIDEKITNNKKLMAELEETARLIYDYWFTQFDFPDEGGKPYKSSGGKMIWSDELKRDIPESWHVEKVESLITVTKGVSYTSQDLIGSGIPMVNLASFETDGTLKLAGMKTYAGIVYDDRTVYPGDLLMCVTQQTSIDPTGKTNVLGKAFRLPDVFDETTIISTDVVKLVPKVNNEHSAVLNQLFKRPEIHKRITGFANGTKIKHLDVAGAMDFYLALPNSGNLIQRFAEISDFLLFREGQLLREIMRLHELRDWLLPMLMNGQLVVE